MPKNDNGSSDLDNLDDASEFGVLSQLPLAYQTGYQNFYGRDFLVTPAVLIPRPESEMLIDEILTLFGKSFLPGVAAPAPLITKNARILDVGTGSGCLAITLKFELPDVEVVASDVSPAALEVARKNGERFSTPLSLIISHLLEKVKEKAIPMPDLVVANLPYVDKNWDWLDLKTLSYEPETALFAEEKGLALIFELIRQAAELKIAWLVLEADPCQHSAIIIFANRYNYKLHNTRGFCLSFCRVKSF